MSEIIKTVGELIDALQTVNIKIFFEIEKEVDESRTVEERFNSGQLVLKLNAKRKRLIDAINALIDPNQIDEFNFGDKTYFKDINMEREF